MLNEIKIGWKTYKIKKVKPDFSLINSGEECYGQIDYDKREIYLNDAINDEEQNKATLIHEILHGIDDMYGLKMEEELITKLADLIYTTIKDNNIGIKGAK